MPSGPAGTSAEFVQTLRRDVNMMAWTGGLERTAERFRALLDAAGFRLERIRPTAAAPLSIVEARPA